MYSEILDRIRTKTEADLLIQEVDLLLSSLYGAEEGSFEETLKNSVRLGVASVIRKEISRSDIGKEEFLEGLKKQIGKLNVLRLVIAFEPTESNVNRIHEWVKENIGNSVIPDIVCDQSVLAGAVIIYKGKYKDFSLRRVLEKKFEDPGKIFEYLP
jgi:hypothetical protein